MRHRQERKYSITIICFDKHFWSVCVCAILFKMYMYVPYQERFSRLSTYVWFPIASTAFSGLCIWNQCTDWKDWCWGRHHFKRKTFYPSLYRLPKDYNIMTGGRSQCLSTKPLEISYHREFQSWRFVKI